MILNLDCREGLSMLPDNSVDSIVCDPPYGLSFMGKKWDYDVPGVDIWIECLRVLKPGAYILAFAGTRTQHRMACRIEDAGFEIRDMIAWVYGSGFPKHQSALKPALEPITMARKPAPRATLLNIDACRVGDEGGCRDDTPYTGGDSVNCYGAGLNGRRSKVIPGLGRYPANLIHDGSEEVLALFPDSAGSGGSVPNVKVTGYGEGYEYFSGERTKVDCGTGSAARFFYCAKASRKDREEGLEGFDVQRCGGMQATADGSMLTGSGNPRTTARANHHPTVKPTELMRYLCRLVTPPGGLIVDPFAGSGTTGKAAVLEGFQFVGFELDPEYATIANARIDAARASLQCP